MKDEISELWELVIAYVRQETVEPLKGLLRYVAFGVAGSIVLVMGLAVMVLGVLRLVQAKTGTAFTGHLSWVPYCIAAGVTVVVSAMSGVGILRVRRAEARANATSRGERGVRK